jgi:hypothetical protein
MDRVLLLGNSLEHGVMSLSNLGDGDLEAGRTVQYIWDHSARVCARCRSLELGPGWTIWNGSRVLSPVGVKRQLGGIHPGRLQGQGTMYGLHSVGSGD